MASIQSNVEKRTPILGEIDILEARLVLDGILVSGLVRDLTQKDRFTSPTREDKPKHR